MSLSTRYVAPMGELITSMMAAFCSSKFLLESNRNLLYFSVYSSVVLNTIVLDPSLRLCLYGVCVGTCGGQEMVLDVYWLLLFEKGPLSE